MVPHDLTQINETIVAPFYLQTFFQFCDKAFFEFVCKIKSKWKCVIRVLRGKKIDFKKCQQKVYNVNKDYKILWCWHVALPIDHYQTRTSQCCRTGAAHFFRDQPEPPPESEAPAPIITQKILLQKLTFWIKFIMFVHKNKRFYSSFRENKCALHLKKLHNEMVDWCKIY